MLLFAFVRIPSYLYGNFDFKATTLHSSVQSLKKKALISPFFLMLIAFWLLLTTVTDMRVVALAKKTITSIC